MAATAQEGLTHRVVREDTAGAVAGSRDPRNKVGRSKRGLRSLAAAVSLSVALTAAAFYVSGSPSPSSGRQAVKASGATVAIVRAGSVAAEAVIALAAWMVWAEGGLHRRPAAILGPFAAQLAAAAAWPVLVLRLGAGGAGLAACAAMAGGAAACVRGFGGVNPVAGDLAKPCVAWAVLLAVINYKML